MCRGATVLYKIPKVVIGENTTFISAENYLRLNNVELINNNNSKCKKYMTDFIGKNPSLWNEGIGK